ncbi:MAG: BspA family leucine-rich repeat surface protein, partial [Coriobacteriales bacterium]
MGKEKSRGRVFVDKAWRIICAVILIVSLAPTAPQQAFAADTSENAVSTDVESDNTDSSDAAQEEPVDATDGAESSDEDAGTQVLTETTDQSADTSADSSDAQTSKATSSSESRAAKKVAQVATSAYDGTAYAVLSEDGTTLTFVRSHNSVANGTSGATVTDLEGESHKGTVYTGFETATYTIDGSTSTAPWGGTKNTVTSVVFKDKVKPVSTGWWFYYFSKLTSIDLTGLDTSSVDDMSGMFSHCSVLESIDISGLNTSNSTRMGRMFEGCTELKSINLSGLDTSKVTFMDNMFNNCSSLESRDLSGFDM